MREETVAPKKGDGDLSTSLAQIVAAGFDESIERSHDRTDHGHAEVAGGRSFCGLSRNHAPQGADAMVQPRRPAQRQQLEQRSFSLQLRRQLSARLRIVARPNAVPARPLDVSPLIVPDMKRPLRVDLLLGQIFGEQLLALAVAVLARGVQKIPAEIGAAIAQQMGKLLRAPIRVRDEADAEALTFHFQILLKHFRICATKVELGAELGDGKIVQRLAVEAEQSERKERIDIRDADLG
ncbi:hypothetical protein [Bradyrhizobium sp. STM 3843]|uniref:hypothetical protein n=1 Tax=Bradyrhizobium sp. STM 3843 TaxID=551947 RepID=UPI001FCC00A1|nr:hypothetical protein [Bradyrhizobium sp. STM 3843]